MVTGQFRHGGGRVRFESPRLDAPLKDAHWELFLPPDYDYDSFEGSMIHDSSDLVPVEQDFTIAEYARQENAQVATVQSETKDALTQARQQIAAGNYGAVERLTQNNLRSGNVRDAETSRELKQLETEFNRVQSSNFINGQNSFSAQNPLGNGEAPVADNRNNDYDARVAEQQVEQLRKAQAVAVTRVQPLRVTLPTRGIRHTFSQVLQTGVDKPLTVTLRAKSTREMGWFARIGLWVGGFLALWISCACAVGFRRPARL